MVFEPGTDLLDARQVVAEKVAEAAVALPGVSSPPHMLQPLSATSRVLTARLTSSTMSPIEMSVLARWVITPRLLGVTGVSNVSVWGQRDRQLQVLVDPARLAERDVTLQQIVNTTGNALWVSPLTFLEASTPGTAGFIDTANQRLGIRHVLPVQTGPDLERIPIEDAEGTSVIVDGQPLRLGDVAQIVEDHQPLIGDASFTSGDGLLLVVEKFPGANTVDVTRGVEEALDAMRPGLGDMRIDTSLFRPADRIGSSMSLLGILLLIGAALLVLVIAAFSSGWRAALLCLVVIPIALLAAGAVLYAFDVTVNMMVVGGLLMALGVVVADAVTDAANVVTRLRRPHGDGDGGSLPTWRRILEASLEMRSALAYAAIVSIVAAVPAFFLTGQPGAFLPPLVGAYILATVVSMVIALTLTPALSMILLSGDVRDRGWAPVRTLRALATPSVTGLDRPRRAFAIGGAILVAGLVAFPFVDGASRVSLHDDDVLVQLEAAAGTSLPAMQETTSAIVDELSALPGVDTASAHIGRAVNGDQVVGINSAQVWVSVSSSAERDATLAAMRRVVDAHTDVSSRIGNYPEQQLTSALEGTDEDVVVRLYGPDAGALRSGAAAVADAIAGIDGVTRPRVELPASEDTIEIEVDLERAQAYAVKPGDVRRAAAILLSGLTVGNLFEEQKVFDVVVWGTPDIRQDVDDVRNLLIDTPSGLQVRLGDLADVRVAPNLTVVQHEASSNYLDVSATIAGRDAGDVVADVRRAVAGVELVPEHHAEIRGSFADESASRTRFLAVLVAALVGVFLLLQAAFMSWRLAALAFATLPLALAGGVVAVVLIGGTATIGAAAGFIGVIAIATRNAVVFIKGSQEIERADGVPFGRDTVAGASIERLPAIVTSALGTVVLLAPVLARGDVAGLEIVRPIAAVMVGGIVSATAVATFVLPALFLRYGHVAHRDSVVDDLTISLPEAEREVAAATGGA
jgi:Cu/Ag efflux pump CusA